MKNSFAVLHPWVSYVSIHKIVIQQCMLKTFFSTKYKWHNIKQYNYPITTSITKRKAAASAGGPLKIIYLRMVIFYLNFDNFDTQRQQEK